MSISLEKVKKLAEELLVTSDTWQSQEFRSSIERLICQLVENVSVDNYKKSFQYLTAIKIIFSLANRGSENESEIPKLIAELLAELANNSAIRQNELDNSATFAELQENQADNKDLNLEVRQSAILAKIKELSVKEGNCGFKELKEAFPDISERTLRYDLQKLSARGIITKVGNRGPNTAYRVGN